MNLIKRLMKMPQQHKILLVVAVVVLLWALFVKNGVSNLSAGGSVHLGNLRASLELEAFENENKPTMYVLCSMVWSLSKSLCLNMMVLCVMLKIMLILMLLKLTVMKNLK